VAGGHQGAVWGNPIAVGLTSLCRVGYSDRWSFWGPQDTLDVQQELVERLVFLLIPGLNLWGRGSSLHLLSDHLEVVGRGVHFATLESIHLERPDVHGGGSTIKH